MARAKISQLTAEQEARLLLFRDEYFAHGTSTAPADRPRAEAAFARAYRTIGREPVPVIWVDSPLTASLAFAMLEHLDLKETSERLWGSLMGRLRGRLQGSLRESLRESHWGSLGGGLTGRLQGSLMGSLQGSLWGSLWESLGGSLWGSQIQPQDTYWWGQQDLYWIAFYRFCADIGVQYDHGDADKLEIMHEIGLSCMWWYPRDGLIIACERPSIVAMDERGRLHSDIGPAVQFRDGWSIYAVHGVRVPAWIFEEPARLTLAAIDAESNSEIQRVMIERFGWERYAADGGAALIDHDERWGSLYQRGEGGVFLRVVNRSPEPDGSFRHYVLPVHPECRPLPDPADPQGVLGDPQPLTALNAVASTFGLTGERYARELVAES